MKSQKHNSKYKTSLVNRCYQFSLQVITLIDDLPNQKSNWVLSDQLIRSATSIGANLVEATGSSSKKDFKHFHEISLKSANETKYWLGLLRDSGKAPTVICNPLLSEVSELSNMIAAGIMKMKGKR